MPEAHELSLWNLFLKLIRRKIADERLVTLIARALKAGIVINGKFEKTTKGCPQGSPLSPILSNIVLNELDQELEQRGHRYCRWADDFVILLKSERAGQRVMEGITIYLERQLNLPVNKQKSQVALVKDVAFLRFQILREKIRVINKARCKFKDKVRKLTCRNNPLSMQQAIKPQQAHRVWVKMNKWQSVERKEVRFVMNFRWFRKQGLLFLHDFTQRQQPLEFTFSR